MLSVSSWYRFSISILQAILLFHCWNFSLSPFFNRFSYFVLLLKQFISVIFRFLWNDSSIFYKSIMTLGTRLFVNCESYRFDKKVFIYLFVFSHLIPILIGGFGIVVKKVFLDLGGYHWTIQKYMYTNCISAK